MSRFKLSIVMRILLGLILLAVVLCALAVYSSKRFLNKAFGPEFQTDAHDLGIALQGIAGESLFEHGTLVPGEQQMPAGSNGIEKGKTLLADYRRDPEKFKKYSLLLQTALNASVVANALLQMPVPAKIPPDSGGITSLRTDQKTDAWTHPFCLTTAGDRLAVISAGPSLKSQFACDKLSVSRKEILSAERKLYERPSGEVVLIVERSSKKHAFEQATQKP